MSIRHSDTYSRPPGAQHLVGWTAAPGHFVAVDVKITRTIVYQAFSVPNCID